MERVMAYQVDAFSQRPRKREEDIDDGGQICDQLATPLEKPIESLGCFRNTAKTESGEL